MVCGRVERATSFFHFMVVMWAATRDTSTIACSTAFVLYTHLLLERHLFIPSRLDVSVVTVKCCKVWDFCKQAYYWIRMSV